MLEVLEGAEETEEELMLHMDKLNPVSYTHLTLPTN